MNETKYLQTEGSWAPLGYPKAPWLIRNCGCGEVAICNGLIEMEQYKNYTPATIQPYCRQFAEPHGNGTYHSGIPAMMKHYGLTEVAEHATMTKLWEQLRKGGRLAILLMGSKNAGSKGVHWTGSGHFVVVTNYKEQNGKHYLYVKDSASNSSLRNKWITYEDNIRGACLKCWSGKMPSAAANITPTKVTKISLIVDGIGGPATVKATQQFFGTTKDGVISGQVKKQMQYYPSLTSVKFGKGGSECVKALQRWLGVEKDGILGKGTAAAWQHKLKTEGYYTGIIDGIFGAMSMKAWQWYLNVRLYGAEPPKKTEEKTEEKKTETTKVDYGEFPSTKLVKTNAECIADAIKFLKWIAGDNTFHYGYTNKHGSTDPSKWNPNAHHNGCYFCGTNTDKGGRSKKGIVDYQYTYCCNPLIGASWAHGGCVPKAIELCRKGSSWNFEKGSGYDKSSLFTNLGKPAKSKLKAGDVLCSDSHVAMYIGNGQIAEAAGGDDNKKGSAKWNNSIHITTLTDKRYSGFKRVHRFNSSVNTTCCMYHGEVGKRVELLQAFLKWYGYDIVVDGLFGDATLKAVKDFQKKSGITADGIVGPNTINAMKAVRK